VNVERLVGPIRTYAWGSHRFIGELQGRRTPTLEPEAELWLGAHPAASAEVERGGTRTLLLDFIAADPELALGPELTARFDGELPFLMKVLAAAQPLSLQAHPSRAQAEAGFESEQAQGLPLSAPLRNYKDRRHKPELIVALTPFSALSGFRRTDTSLRLFRELALPALEPYLGTLAAADTRQALGQTFASLMTASPETRSQLATATLEAVERASRSASEFRREFTWAARLGALYPGDIGIVGALLLNLIELEPYQGMFLPAGNLHAYLQGAGVEIMAASDNVLRGGLTPKSVNVTELLRILDFAQFEPVALSPSANESGEHVYPTSTEEFRLSYFELAGAAQVLASHGPEIVLVTAGQVNLEYSAGSLALESGGAAFVPACEPGYRLRGAGTIFRAAVGPPSGA
jgi:mannose-6-phosphate isomerase